MNPNREFQENVQPVATAPVTPSPLPTTPSVPITGGNIAGDVSYGAQQPTEAAVAPQQPTQPVTFNGSVVDLLNTAGVDSSQAARKQLASQYGIQGYDFSADKNKELASKFLEAYNANKAKPIPESGAAAASALDSYFEQSPVLGDQQDPIGASFDIYGGMDPVQAKVFDTISQIMSQLNTQQTFQEELSKVLGPELQQEKALFAEGMNLKRLMEGQEDAVREEIQAAGGFATEQMIQNITITRNKTLLRRANQVSDELATLDNYIDRVTSLTKANRDDVRQSLMDKLGLTQTLFSMSQSMQNASKENYNNIVSQVGYTGLAQLLQNAPQQQAQVEKTLGLPLGTLSNPAFLEMAKPKQKLTTQVTEIDGRRALLTFDQNGNPTNVVDLGSAASGSGGLTPGQVNAFNSIVSKYNSSPLIAAADRTVVLKNTINEIKKNPNNGAQQLNLAYSYIQALDTYQSAVREGELSLVNSIDSKVGQVKNYVEQIQNGQIVRPEVAKQIADAAETIVDTINASAKQKAQSFASQANVVGLGPYWNQYVSGFDQSYNQTSPTQKGTLSSSEYVDKVLTEHGLSYQQILESIPLGSIGVIDNETGEVGSIPAEEFDPSIYTRI